MTREPIPWFDLVTACGLDDVRATSLQGVNSGECLYSSDDAADTSFSVAQVAVEMMSFFGDKFDRRMIALQEIAGRDETEVWKKIARHIREAEDQAEERITISPPPRRPLSAL